MAMSKNKPVNDMTAFERQAGLHLSLGKKHNVFKKPGMKAYLRQWGSTGLHALHNNVHVSIQCLHSFRYKIIICQVPHRYVC